jgi:predicted NodU family carbamoyl transferase
VNILGINSVYHDSAAALLVDGRLVVAVEEERFNRIKHGKLPHVDTPHQLPERAIRFCLNYAGLTAGDIDHVAFSFDPQLRRTEFRPEWWVDPRFEEVFLLRQSGDFSDVFIPSAPHDAGTAVGAAFVVHCARQKSHPERGNSTPFLGPAFNRREILAAVKSAGLTPRRSKSAARDAADMVVDGKIVAWFQGRMEFGPRALGNRSLLADPRRPDMRNILNQWSSTVRTSGRLHRASWPNTPTNGSRLAPTRRVTNSCCLRVG